MGSKLVHVHRNIEMMTTGEELDKQKRGELWERMQTMEDKLLEKIQRAAREIERKIQIKTLEVEDTMRRLKELWKTGSEERMGEGSTVPLEPAEMVQPAEMKQPEMTEQEASVHLRKLTETVVGMREAFTRKCRQVGKVRNPVMCFRCEQWGHFARKCPERDFRWCHGRRQTALIPG